MTIRSTRCMWSSGPGYLQNLVKTGGQASSTVIADSFQSASLSFRNSCSHSTWNTTMAKSVLRQIEPGCRDEGFTEPHDRISSTRRPGNIYYWHSSLQSIFRGSTYREWRYLRNVPKHSLSHPGSPMDLLSIIRQAYSNWKQ